MACADVLRVSPRLAYPLSPLSALVNTDSYAYIVGNAEIPWGVGGTIS